MSPFLTVADLAERWKTTEHAVRNMRSRGQLPPATKIGKRLLWNLDEIEGFEAARRETPAELAAPAPKPAAWPAKTRDYSQWGKVV